LLYVPAYSPGYDPMEEEAFSKKIKNLPSKTAARSKGALA